MQKLIVAMALTAVVCSCNNNGKSTDPAKKTGDSTYVLSGKIDGLDSGWIYLYNIQKNQKYLIQLK